MKVSFVYSTYNDDQTQVLSTFVDWFSFAILLQNVKLLKCPYQLTLTRIQPTVTEKLGQDEPNSAGSDLQHMAAVPDRPPKVENAPKVDQWKNDFPDGSSWSEVEGGDIRDKVKIR